MTFLSRLNFTFDPTKFGTATDPDGKLKTNLAQGPSVLTTSTSTSYSLAVSSNTATATYYQNPLATLCTSLSTRITQVYNLFYNARWDQISYDGDTGAQISTPIYLYRDRTVLIAQYGAVIRELTETDNNASHSPLSYNTFIGHTNRLSNLDYSNKSTRPDFNTGISAGKTVQKIVYQTEKELTTDDVIAGLGLGCFTSLFISSDLDAHLSTLNSLFNTANTLFGIQPLAVTEGSYSATTAMNNCATAVEDEFTALLVLLQQRRTQDENFYVAANSITTDVNKVNQLVNSVTKSDFSNPSVKTLVDNYVGKTALKNLTPS